MSRQSSHANIEEDILQVLDKVANTGIPLEIERKGRRLLISPAVKQRELGCLENHPDFIIGNPDDLVHLDWASARDINTHIS